MSKRRVSRQVLALLLLALLMVVISSGLEQIEVFRSAIGRADAESRLVASGVRRQLVFLSADRPGVTLAELADEVRLQMVMNDAQARASTILHVAICDSSGIAIAHTLTEAIGDTLTTRPALPAVATFSEASGALVDFWRNPVDFESLTLLSDREGRSVGSIRVVLGAAFLQHDLDHALRRGLVTAVLVSIIAVIAGMFLSMLASRRLRFLEAGVAALREGHFEQEIPESGLEEFDRLARELNLLGRQVQKQREAEGALAHPTANLLGNAILVIDPERKVVFVNAIARDRLGLDDSAVDRPIDDLVPPTHPLIELLAALEGGSGRSSAVRLPPGEDGERCAAVGHRIDDGPHSAGTLIELKHESDLAEIHFLVDQSRVLNRLGEMAAGVAHELRGPLQSIHFDLDALRTSLLRDPESSREILSDVHDKVQRLEWAVKGFLKVARLRPLTMEQIEVDDLLQEVASQLEAEALMGGVSLEVDLDDEVLHSLGDREVLSQAVKNLVSNAIQARPSRTGKVVLRARPEGDEVRIEVEDSGPGIATEHIDRIFDLYFTTREEGTGVGLALVRQTAELHRGECRVETAPGGGTRMVLVLPRHESSTFLV